jgi:hypothetical protein
MKKIISPQDFTLDAMAKCCNMTKMVAIDKIAKKYKIILNLY